MTAPSVLSFIIPVRNDAAGLRRCLSGLAAAADGLEWEVVVVDNGSTDSSTNVAMEAGASVVNAPGIRVSAVRNRGALSARSELLAFIDADNEVGPGWAHAAIQVLSNSDVAAVGAPYRAPSPGTWVQRSFDGLRQHPPATEETEWLASGNLVVRRTAFVAVSGFDETLETCEDVDFCRRLRAAGWRLLADPRLESVHHGDPSTLTDVFRGEWWRGRDNLRVSFRAPRSWRSLFSAGLSIAMVVALGTICVGVTTGLTGDTAVWVSATVIVAVLLVRTARIVRGVGSWQPLALFQALAVAAAYEAGRAMALVSRASHARRQARPR